MKLLVGMECSGQIRRAARERGIDAWSCDLKPSDDNSPYHIQGDIFEVAYGQSWDAGIAHPVCRYLTHAGIKHLFKTPGQMPLTRNEERWDKMRKAAMFFQEILKLPFPVVCENPQMHPYALNEIGVWPFCKVQPHEHGDKAFKGTYFWRNDERFQPLQPTNKLQAPKYGTPEYKEWSAIFRMPPSADREAKRSETFPGIAAAIVEQWFVPLDYQEYIPEGHYIHTDADGERYVKIQQKDTQ